MVCYGTVVRKIPLLTILIIACMTIITPASAAEYSIPVNGRFGSSRITLAIPSTPKWAHDVVLNASLVWNRAQLWYQQTYSPDGNVFTYVESRLANATVTFTLPTLCAGFAVGWTEYDLAQSSNTILSARIFLDQAVFSAAQENNVTARHYAFWLALHELGRVLGLGSVLDGRDIMDPRGTANRITQPPMLSTLDLFAVHILASESYYTSPIVLNTDQYQLLNAWDFTGNGLRNESRMLRASLSGTSLNPVEYSALGNQGRQDIAGNSRLALTALYAIILSAAFVASSMLLRRRSRRSTQLVTK